MGISQRSVHKSNRFDVPKPLFMFKMAFFFYLYYWRKCDPQLLVLSRFVNKKTCAQDINTYYTWSILNEIDRFTLEFWDKLLWASRGMVLITPFCFFFFLIGENYVLYNITEKFTQENFKPLEQNEKLPKLHFMQKLHFSIFEWL